ncbi:hypothetical protein [Persicirhabdus sediminis]|uniref:Uncharacterized protein n=1 Tax=Persicirhabdus sediminis TaxID=454144 RepID=A0A8J7MJ68_9BACT|nr:hypothetical protein [Persicirhabdus sediminis]MBK1791983.1 hypothetical protein [Persicirhabdus sediminis]
MKKLLLILSPLVTASLLYGILYIYAYYNDDLDDISGHSATADYPPAAERSLLHLILKPTAQLHQHRLAIESAQDLDGTWIISEDEAHSGLPNTLTITYLSDNQITISPSISAQNTEYTTFAVTRWITPDFPTAIHTNTPINIAIYSDEEISIQTPDMDVFGLGAMYKRKH